MEMDQLLQGSVSAKESLLIVAGSEEYQDTKTDVIEHLSNEDLSGVYVAVDKPYESLTNDLENQNIETSDIFFLDAISKDQGINKTNNPKDQQNVVFLESPQNLTDLSISLAEAVKFIEGEKYILIDSLSGLAVHNQEKTLTKFVKFIENKRRKWDIAGFMFVLSNETDDLMFSQIRSICDKEIRV